MHSVEEVSFHEKIQPPQPPEKRTSGSHNKWETFEPCMFFLYGTLMDPDVIRAVAVLENTPQLQDAWLEEFELKMWHGRYPTLLAKEGASSKIKGKLWQATSMDQFLGLQFYQTWAYECCDCVVQTADGQSIKALTFKWANDGNSAELLEGGFDLEQGQKDHKSSICKTDAAP